MNGLSLDPDLTVRILTDFIATEVRKVGFSSVVLGLSGGIDSAVSASLAARALGPDNVFAVMMPAATSSPESLEHAREVVRGLGLPSAVEEISSMVDPYLARHEDAGPLRRGNVMARQRMIVLYDYSAARGALVLGTSNKTEALLGYSTLWGDMAAALQPLGDLYKCQVRQIGAHLGVPAAILAKPPSADLWEGQTDEDEMGFTYEQADELLYLLVDRRYTVAEMVAAGYSADLVRRVFGKMQRSQFKRRLPVIAKVSGRTIDRDFRYPRDWGA